MHIISVRGNKGGHFEKETISHIQEKEKKKKTTCKNCGAVLSYEMEDVCRCQNSPWDTGHGYIIDCPDVEAFGHITCPQCNYRIDV